MPLNRNDHTQEARKLVNFLEARKKSLSPLLILTHDFPDPDALASAYALHFLASRIYHIHTRIVYKGIIGRVENRNMVNFLELPVHRIKPRELSRYENVALVDTQPDFENNPFPENRRAAIVIDQHTPVNSPSADLTIIDKECGATSVILAKAILSLNIEIPERLATALAYGIISDTLSLYRARRADITDTYLKVLGQADIHSLARIQIPEYDKNYFITLNNAITKALMRKDLLICHIGHVKVPELVAQIAEYFLCYKKSEVVLTTGRFKNKLHASLRTRSREYHAADLLRKCFVKPEDAGGHGNVAGGAVSVHNTSEKNWSAEEKHIENNILKLLKLRSGSRFSYPFRGVG